MAVPAASRQEHAERLRHAAASRRTGMLGLARHFIASAREERLSAMWSRA